MRMLENVHSSVAKFFLVLFLASAPCSALAHDFHMSYCKSELTSGSFIGQVSYYKDDLLLALKKWSGKEVQGLAKDQFDKLVVDYLRTAFRARVNDSRPLTLDIAGCEEDAGSILVHFRFLSGVSIQSITIEHTVLFSEFKDQMNLMVIKTRYKEFNQIFERSAPSITLTFDQPL